MFFVRAETLFFHRLGRAWLACLVSGHGRQRSHERGRKTVHEISQSASQLKVLEQKRPALSERNAVMLSLILASASKLPFGETVKVPKPSFDFTLQYFLCFEAKHRQFVGGADNFVRGAKSLRGANSLRYIDTDVR